MRHSAYILCLIPLMQTSCIMEDIPDCDAGGTVYVSIHDRNYSNTDEIGWLAKMDENLPFSSYVTDLTAWRFSGDNETSEPFTATSHGKDATIGLQYLKQGENEILLIGNEAGLAHEPWTAGTVCELHPKSKEYTDIYIGSGKAFLPIYEDVTISLYRTKGKLLIIPEHFPPETTGAEVTISDISKTIGKDLGYSGSTEIVKDFSEADVTGKEAMSILCAPSIPPSYVSDVRIRLTRQDGSIMILSNIKTSIRRNMISVIKPVYHPDSDEWTLETMVDGKWTQTDNLHIQTRLPDR